MGATTIYRISFLSHGQVYEIYARHVGQGGLFGFIEVDELLFGERTKIVIDSSEERLKTEFEGVRRTYIPIHAVLRIDEVEKAGRGRISGKGETVTSFPVTLVQPPEGTTSE